MVPVVLLLTVRSASLVKKPLATKALPVRQLSIDASRAYRSALHRCTYISVGMVPVELVRTSR
jgi:hypothetical protein